MFLVIIGIIIAGIVFFKYCEGVGRTEEEYTNRPPEWNPPRPSLPHFNSIDDIPYKSGCCCANCKYLYNGSKTEYWFDGNELKGKSETTHYKNWCLMNNCAVGRELGYHLHEIHNCGAYDPK